jgi:hypothetical protein
LRGVNYKIFPKYWGGVITRFYKKPVGFDYNI